MLKSKQAKWLSLIMCFMMITSSLAFAVVPTKATDIKGHSAEKIISSWMEKGMITPGVDGKFHPYSEITRGELASMVNAAFDFKVKSSTGYVDLKKSHPNYKDLMIAKKAGYLTAIKGKINPNGKVTQEEFAVVLANLLKLNTKATAAELKKVKDASAIAKKDLGAVAAVLKAGYLSLDKAGKFYPNKHLAKATVLVKLDKAYKSVVKVTYNKKGVYSAKYVKGTVRIDSRDVTLKNTIIDGNLIIGKGVGNGNVTLKNIKVTGDTIVNGGGMNTIILDGSTFDRIVVDKVDNKVRIYAIGKTNVGEVNMQSGGKLEEKAGNTSGSGFSRVLIAESVNANEPVTLTGNFQSVQINADGVSLNLTQGNIAKLDVTPAAQNSKVNVAADATVTKMDVKSSMTIDGAGTVGNVAVDASNVKLGVLGTMAITKVDIAAGFNNSTLDLSTASKVTTVDAKSALNISGTGTLQEVKITASNVQVNVTGATTIEKMTVAGSAAGAGIDLGSQARVTNLVLDAVASVVGAGKVTTATVNVTGANIGVSTGTITAAPGISYTQNNTSATGSTTGSTPSSGGGGGGGTTSTTVNVTAIGSVALAVRAGSFDYGFAFKDASDNLIAYDATTLASTYGLDLDNSVVTLATGTTGSAVTVGNTVALSNAALNLTTTNKSADDSVYANFTNGSTMMTAFGLTATPASIPTLVKIDLKCKATVDGKTVTNAWTDKSSGWVAIPQTSGLSNLAINNSSTGLPISGFTFDPATFTYSSVVTTCTAITVEPTWSVSTTDSAITMLINGADATQLTSGTTSSAISLDIPKTLTIMTMENGKVPTIYNITVTGKVLDPTVTSTTASAIQLVSATSGASFVYTVDGTTPTATNGTATNGIQSVTGLIDLTTPGALKVIAVKGGMANSEVTSFVTLFTTQSALGITTDAAITVYLGGDTFTGGISSYSNWTFDAGTTGFDISTATITPDSSTQVTITFTGTPTAGTMIIQPKAAILTGGVVPINAANVTFSGP